MHHFVHLNVIYKSLFIIQFFTMHETLHTYRFWAFGEKTPSLLFMLREEKIFMYNNVHNALMKNTQASWKHSPKLFSEDEDCVSLWLNTIFTLSKHTSEDQYCVPFLCHMQHDVWCLCYAKWCDDVMLRRWHLFREIHTYPRTIFLYQRWLFAVSSAFP